MLARLLVALSCVVASALPSHALSFAGNASTTATGGTAQYVTLTGPESTTGPLSTTGTCSGATGQSWLSAAAGALALRVSCSGAPGVSCVSDGYASGNSSYSDDFVVQSATLPPGTPVDVALCVRAAIRHGIQFACGNNVFEGVTSTASAQVLIYESSNPPRIANGTYAERWNCFDGHDLTETGIFRSGGVETTLVLNQVPVGATVTVSTSLTAATGERSFTNPDGGRVEMAVVFGYSATGDVRLVSIATSNELSPAGNCTIGNLDHWLPPASGTVAVEPLPPAGRAELRPPAPNPSAGPTTVSFTLPTRGRADLFVCDVAGARVATLASGWLPAGGHERTWNGHDDEGRPLRPGVYWLRLSTPGGVASRAIVRLR